MGAERVTEQAPTAPQSGQPANVAAGDLPGTVPLPTEQPMPETAPQAAVPEALEPQDATNAPPAEQAAVTEVPAEQAAVTEVPAEQAAVTEVPAEQAPDQPAGAPDQAATQTPQDIAADNDQEA
jgi:hypothetical protein